MIRVTRVLDGCCARCRNAHIFDAFEFSNVSILCALLRAEGSCAVVPQIRSFTVALCTAFRILCPDLTNICVRCPIVARDPSAKGPSSSTPNHEPSRLSRLTIRTPKSQASALSSNDFRVPSLTRSPCHRSGLAGGSIPGWSGRTCRWL